VLPDANPNPHKHVMPLTQPPLAISPNANPDPRKHLTTQPMSTVLSDTTPGTEEQRPAYRNPRPGLAVASGRGRSPDIPSPWGQHPHRQEVAA